MAEVAFIGLGNMGYPMAGHLSRAAHAVTVFNRTASTAERWQTEYAGSIAASPAAAARDAEFVFTCVGNDDDLRSVTSGARVRRASRSTCAWDASKLSMQVRQPGGRGTRSMMATWTCRRCSRATIDSR